MKPKPFYDKTGSYYHFIRYYKNNDERNDILHREDGPAVTIIYARNGDIHSHVYKCNGVEHRLDGPSHFDYSMKSFHGGPQRLMNVVFRVNGISLCEIPYSNNKPIIGSMKIKLRTALI
jgi:hypothetical protein